MDDAANGSEMSGTLRCLKAFGWVGLGASQTLSAMDTNFLGECVLWMCLTFFSTNETGRALNNEKFKRQRHCVPAFAALEDSRAWQGGVATDPCCEAVGQWKTWQNEVEGATLLVLKSMSGKMCIFKEGNDQRCLCCFRMVYCILLSLPPRFYMIFYDILWISI